MASIIASQPSQVSHRRWSAPILEALPATLEHVTLSWLDLEHLVAFMRCNHMAQTMIMTYIAATHSLRLYSPPTITMCWLLAYHARSLRVLNMISVAAIDRISGVAILRQTLTRVITLNIAHFQHLELPPVGDAIIPWSLLPTCASLTGLTIPTSPRDTNDAERAVTIRQCIAQCKQLAILHLDYHRVDIRDVFSAGLPLQFVLVRELPLLAVISLYRHPLLHTIDFTLGADSVVYARQLKFALESLPLLGSLYIDCEGHRLLPTPDNNDDNDLHHDRDNDDDIDNHNNDALTVDECTWRLPSLRRITLTDVAGELPYLHVPLLRAATIERRTPDGAPQYGVVRVPLADVLVKSDQLRELEVIDDHYASDAIIGLPTIYTMIRLLEIPSQLSIRAMHTITNGWSHITRLVMGCAQTTGSVALIDGIATRLPLLVHLTLRGTGAFTHVSPYNIHDIAALTAGAPLSLPIAAESSSSSDTSSDSKREKSLLDPSLPLAELIHVSPVATPYPLPTAPSHVIHHRLEEIHCDTFITDNPPLRASFVQLLKRCPVIHTVLCDPVIMAAPLPLCDITVNQWMAQQPAII